MSRHALVLVCLVLVVTCAPASAADAMAVNAPSVGMPDRSGELGAQLDYLCQRQLGADCRDRLVLGGSSYLKEPYTQAKPGQRMGEHQVRPLAALAFASATLLTFGNYDESTTGISRREMARICASLIRELATHHASNADKSSWWWGNEWQSAYWTALAGQGAWIGWDRLPSDTRQMVARMVASEADRFLGGPAPHSEFSDTKAEENAWDSEVMVLAACMMPSHPHAAAWEEKAKEYMVTSFATPQDLKSEEIVDGKPLKDWLAGPNVHADYTLENHGFFHPDYETAYYLSVDNLPIYALAGKKAPQSVCHNVAKLRDIINFLTLPNGWTFYPQCTDWNNYRHDVTIMAQSTDPVMPDAVGARCLRWGLDFVRYADSLNVGKGSVNLFRGLNFNCCPLDTMTHVYLMHYLLGPGEAPLSDGQAREKLAGTRLYEQGKCVLCRSRDSMASFSWFDSGKRLMACVTPMAKDCLMLPKFRSLIGTIGGKIDDAEMKRQSTEVLDGGGFAVRALVKRGPELSIEEKVMMVALADGRVIWAEWFGGKIGDDVEARTGLVFFENDPYWLRGAKTRIFCPEGSWASPAEQKVLKDATWLNVSDRLGIVLRGAKSSLIANGQLALNYRAAGGQLSPCMVAVFYPDSDRQETARASDRIRISGMGANVVTVDLGDRKVTLDPDRGE